MVGSDIRGDLEVVHMDMDRMLVIVLVPEHPFLDRIEPRLQDRHIGEGLAVERVDEGLRIGLAGEVVQEAAIDQDVPRQVRREALRGPRRR